jgi:D-glycero-alpha-D-manno-heptose-7-phosphate kinase
MNVYLRAVIITKTPFRISFVGGGSDLEAFYSRSDGAVLSTSINKYMYLTTHKFFDPQKLQVKYSRTETVQHPSELQHPIFRVAFEQFGIEGGIEATSVADIAAGTGMGSSSTFTVGLLHNLYTRHHRFVTKERLASEACRIEIEKLGEPIGKQDQYAAAYGGLNVIVFKKEGTVLVEPLHLDAEIYKAFQDSLVLLYLGTQRSASGILSEQKKNTVSDEAKFAHLQQMVGLVYELRDALYNGALAHAGQLLHENWLLKQKLASGIANPAIEEAYKAGLEAGAWGGKLLGAGGGGFLLFACPPTAKQRLLEKLSALRTFDFRFEQEGSKVIYVEEE